MVESRQSGWNPATLERRGDPRLNPRAEIDTAGRFRNSRQDGVSHLDAKAAADQARITVSIKYRGLSMSRYECDHPGLKLAGDRVGMGGSNRRGATPEESNRSISEVDDPPLNGPVDNRHAEVQVEIIG